MATGHVAWVLLGSGARADAPQNCIKTVVSAEAVTFGANPGTATGVCPSGANAAIVRAVDAAGYARKGTTSSLATGVYVPSGGAEVFWVEPGDKVALSTT